MNGLLNYWQSVKWQGRFESIQKEVEQADFSAKDPLYQLAQLVNRKQSAVLQDCNELEAYGFIRYEKGGTRNSKTPLLAFDYDTIEVHDVRGRQRHELPRVA